MFSLSIKPQVEKPPFIFNTSPSVSVEYCNFSAVILLEEIAEFGNPVALVNTKADGVPKAGVVSVGLVPNTKAPLPVSSPTIVANSEDVSKSVTVKSFTQAEPL